MYVYHIYMNNLPARGITDGRPRARAKEYVTAHDTHTHTNTCCPGRCRRDSERCSHRHALSACFVVYSATDDIASCSRNMCWHRYHSSATIFYNTQGIYIYMYTSKDSQLWYKLSTWYKKIRWTSSKEYLYVGYVKRSNNWRWTTIMIQTH